MDDTLLWRSTGESGLLYILQEWFWFTYNNPGYLNKFVSGEFDKMKNKMAPFYFDEPGSWYKNVTLVYKNILAGHDMHDSRAILTGLTTNEFDASWMGNIVTHMLEIKEIYYVPTLKPQKYIEYESAMKNLNSTSCLNLANCHQTRTKVSIT